MVPRHARSLRVKEGVFFMKEFKYLIDKDIERLRPEVILETAKTAIEKGQRPKAAKAIIWRYQKTGRFNNTFLEDFFDGLDLEVGMVFRPDQPVQVEFYPDYFGIKGTNGNDGVWYEKIISNPVREGF